MTDQFHWELEGLNEAHFAALASLLSLRNGGQLEPETVDDSIDADADADADADEDIEHISVCDATEDLLAEASCTPEQLKTQFLDRLAEVISTRKGGYYVASVAMREMERRTTIFVALNSPFRSEDTKFFRTIEKCLSAGSDPKAISDAIGNILCP
jgi:hypothetical protein